MDGIQSDEPGVRDASAHGLEAWDGPTYQDILDLDPRPIPDILRECWPRDIGTEPIKASRYTSAEFFAKEVEKVWLKTWQYACREEEIPNAGDTYVFDLVGKSAIVVRQPDGALAAFRNICLHRGRQLVQEGGCKRRFRCPYHGFTWGLNGALETIPAGWDFPQIGEDFPLLPIRVETWAGFVFLNYDAGAAPLIEVLGPIPRHFAHWRIEDCYKAVHVGKIVEANWKAVAEAFLEGHHVAATHPQLIPYANDANQQCDVLTDHVTRMMGAVGTPGVLADSIPRDQAQVVKAMFAVGSRAGNAQLVPYEPGTTARRFAADVSRQALQAATGYDFSDTCDADVIDAISYDMFPNFHIWGGFAQKIVYRFRPVGLDHERTLMEVFLFKLAPKDGPRPAPAALRMLSEDERWADAPELSYLSGVYDQDQANLKPVQMGLKDLGEGAVHFARYCEVRCRNLHRMIDRYMERA